jgi:L-aspartate oxidase
MARVVHAGGAATGAEIERALVAAVRETAAAVLEGWFALDLVVRDGRCAGVRAVAPDGHMHEVDARHVLVATGGAGQLFAVTTNPAESTGDGVAMALRAGVPVADVEFMQFHPTALHHPAMPRPLLSEALRGHGALLRDRDGNHFVDELAPRDVVSRAMAARMLEQGVDHLWLDATGLERFDERFPTIAASLRQVGLDPARDWLPIAPAAHYLSGGIVTDLDGASGLPGLWACGETACTGVHGANRLASNSLLEGMVFAPRVIETLLAGKDGPDPTGAMRCVLGGGDIPGRPLPSPAQSAELSPESWSRDHVSGDTTGVEAGGDPAKLRDELQRRMTVGAGVLRSAASLDETAGVLHAVGEATADAAVNAEWSELRNLVDVGEALVASALAREESRGAHTRTDFPDTDAAFRCRLVVGSRR